MGFENMKRIKTNIKEYANKEKQPRLTNFFSVRDQRPDTENALPLSEPKPTSLPRAAANTSTTIGVAHSFQSKPTFSSIAKIPCTNSGNKRDFQDSWQKNLVWLEYDKKTGVAKCSTCSHFPDLSDKSSKVVRGFNKPFKLETFKKHAKSFQHIQCVRALEARQHPEKTALAVCVRKMDEKMFEHLNTLFNVSYYIAKNNRPFSDFPELLVLINKFNVQVLKEYTNDKQCREFISCIAGVLRNELVLELKNSPYVSILLDASTDKSKIEELILHVRYIKNNKVNEVFLSIIPMEDGTAEGYLKTIKSELNKLGLQDWITGSKLVGVGTDGASTMIGVENGLVRKLSKKLSHLISVHCVAHKLNLGVLSSVKNVKYLEIVDSILRILYKFYQNSPKQLRRLKQISELLEMQIMKFQYLHKVRWVASKVGALNALLKDWKCVITHLEDLSNEKSDDSDKALGLLKKLKDFRFTITVHFLLDYLNIFKLLSLLFQKEDLILSLIDLHVQKAVSSLENLKAKPGPMEEYFINATSLKGVFQGVQLENVKRSLFEVDKIKLIDSGIQYLRERFPSNEVSIQNATGVFDTLSWPTSENLANYGNNEIEMLGNHFVKQLIPEQFSEQSSVDNQSLLNEWYEIKILCKGLTLSDLLQRVLSRSERFPLLGKLVQIVATLPVSTASCERGFSLMNTIKDKLRTSLQAKSLNDLMMINSNGPSLQDFDPTKSVNNWYFSAKTKIHV